MRRAMFTIAALTLICFGTAASPAFADCSADIQAVERHLASLSGKEKDKNRAAEAAGELLKKAKEASSAGQAKRCEKLAQKALEKLQ